MLGRSILGFWPLASRRRYRARKELIDRQIAILPAHYVEAVGKGEFASTGLDLVNVLVRYAGLQPWHRVLDLGCGLSRLALHLQGYLDARGSYEGIDVIRDMIEWNRLHVTQHDARFRYRHLDVANTLYNRDGGQSAEAVSFPFADGSFDLALATSLFTHLQPEAVDRYVSELARVIQPRGRVATTWFLLNDDSRRGIAGGRSAPELAHEHGGVRVDDPENPDAAVGYDEGWVRGRFAAHGLRLRRTVYGWWSGTRRSKVYQDLLVASRRS